MPYRFKKRESLAQGFARLIEAEIAGTLLALQSRGAAHVAPGQIHQARKGIKRLRALLRLCRSALGEGTFAAENEALRTVARRLMDVRDGAVHRATLEWVLEKTPGISRNASAPLAKGLLAEERAALHSLSLAPARSELVQIRHRLLEQEISAEDWPVIEEGLERSYRRARRALGKALLAPTLENLHAWRRRTKDLWSQVHLLHGAAPKAWRRFERDLEKLGDRLGQDHDLAILGPALTHHARTRRTRSVLAEIAARVGNQRRRRQRQAFKLAARLFHAKPRTLVKAFARGWRRWKAH